MTKYLSGKYNFDCKIFADEVEASALELIQSILNDEVSAGVPVRIMPDVHAGVDIVIGFTMPLTDRVNPAHIGVDVGCGVLCVKIDKSELTLEEIDREIRRAIPMGYHHRAESLDFDIEQTHMRRICEKMGLDYGDVLKQVGTLGGGNHFIEIGESKNNWYLFIHTGSRNFGKQICDYHCKKAKEQGSKYLFGDDAQEYCFDMFLAQEFAQINRKEIYLQLPFRGETICDTVHNYIDIDQDIIRKGAVSAKEGEMLVIPMNMRDGVLLCMGKGNADWNYSAPHGAGRVLARNKAKKELSMDSFKEQMNGIYSTSVCFETLDEAPDAYKNMQTIIDAIGDTVEIIDIVKPILNIKALN